MLENTKDLRVIKNQCILWFRQLIPQSSCVKGLGTWGGELGKGRATGLEKVGGAFCCTLRSLGVRSGREPPSVCFFCFLVHGVNSVLVSSVTGFVQDVLPTLTELPGLY